MGILISVLKAGLQLSLSMSGLFLTIGLYDGTNAYKVFFVAMLISYLGLLLFNYFTEEF